MEWHQFDRRKIILGLAGTVLSGCRSGVPAAPASIHFSRVPQADEGSGSKNDIIQGSVVGARPGQQIVLYAKSEMWWLQPSESAPFTHIQPNSKWINATHLGTEYAALLVDPGYAPPVHTDVLPVPSGSVAAVAVVQGGKSPPSPTIIFSGYEWRVRTALSNRGGTRNLYDPGNAWTDRSGALHLRIANSAGSWRCAEVSLTRNLGFGTYQFSIRDTSLLGPAAAFSIFTWDYSAANENYAEIDIEISQWGDPVNKNAQYVIQPFNVPTNVVRFSNPPGPVTHSFQWQAGRVSFRSARPSGATIAEHDFTSGVPRPGLESVRIALYIYNGGLIQFENGAEVVIDQFEYLP